MWGVWGWFGVRWFGRLAAGVVLSCGGSLLQGCSAASARCCSGARLWCVGWCASDWACLLWCVSAWSCLLWWRGLFGCVAVVAFVVTGPGGGRGRGVGGAGREKASAPRHAARAAQIEGNANASSGGDPWARMTSDKLLSPISESARWDSSPRALARGAGVILLHHGSRRGLGKNRALISSGSGWLPSKNGQRTPTLLRAELRTRGFEPQPDRLRGANFNHSGTDQQNP